MGKILPSKLAGNKKHLTAIEQKNNNRKCKHLRLLCKNYSCEKVFN